MVRALLFIHQADREARKASDVSTAKYDIPSRVLSRLFATPQYFNSICTNVIKLNNSLKTTFHIVGILLRVRTRKF